MELQPQTGGFVETRATGRQIDYQFILMDNIQKITISRNQDIYNSQGSFNTYESLVSNFGDLLDGYKDPQYYSDLESIESTFKELEKDYPYPPRFLKIDYVSYSLRSLMRLCKRKNFIPPDDVMGDETVIVEQIVEWINDEYDGMIIVKGPRGSGKSTLAIKLCIELITRLDLPPFKLRESLFSNSIELREYIYEHRPKPGTPFIFDEAGADKATGKGGASTKEAREFNQMLQVIREMGLIIFYTVPEEEDLTNKNIGIFTGKIETVALFKSIGISIVKFKYKDAGETKDYWKFPKTSSGERISRIKITKPPEEIIKEYKPLKSELMYEKVRVKPHEKKKKAPPFNPDKYAEIILDEGLDPYITEKGIIVIAKIMNRFKDDEIGRQKAEQIKYAIMNLEGLKEESDNGHDINGQQKTQ